MCDDSTDYSEDWSVIGPQLMDQIDRLKFEIAQLKARDKECWTQAGKLKGTGDPAFDVFLGKHDPEFNSFVASLPLTYWAKYDLSAMHAGWYWSRNMPPAENVRDAGPAAFGGRSTARDRE